MAKRLRDAWDVLLGRKAAFACRRDSKILAHARREFLAAGYVVPEDDDEEGPNKWMQEEVLDLLSVFAGQGHSGASAPYCVRSFEKLALFKPLVPLKGTDDEWMEVGTGVYQNRRCSHVFKSEAGGAYDIDGRIFREPNGVCYTSKGSRVAVTFPYTPHSEYVDVPAQEGD